MFFDVKFSDGSARTFQAHNKQQLKMALANVRFWKIVPRGQVAEVVTFDEYAGCEECEHGLPPMPAPPEQEKCTG